jgi:hypothetical protein
MVPEMRKFLIAGLFCILSGPAVAQCNGLFPNQTVCGNTSGANAPPKPIPFTAVTPQNLTPQSFNASGLDTAFTGTISAGSTTLTLTHAGDFQPNQGIWVPGAGASNTAAVPTTGAATVVCTASCTNTLTYKLVGRDAAGGQSAASGAITAASSASVANMKYSRDPIYNNRNTIAFSCGANDIDVVIYRAGDPNPNNNGPAAIVPCADASFIDVGQPTLQSRDIAATAPASATPAPLLTTVVSGGTGTSLTLANAAVNAVSGISIYHDDGAALQSMFNTICNSSTQSYVIFPLGNYNTHTPLQCLPNPSGIFFAYGITLAGQGSLQFDNLQGAVPMPGSQIVYWGRGDKPLFYANGLNGSHFSDLVFNANAYAQYAVQLDNSDGTHSSSNNFFIRTKFFGANSPVSGSLFVVNNSSCSGGSSQVSELFFEGVFFEGLGVFGAPRDAFTAYCGGNTKNFQFVNTQSTWTANFAAARSGVSGTWSFIHTVAIVGDTMFLNVAPANLYVASLESESSPGARLALITGSNNNSCQATFHNVHWPDTAPTSSDNFIDVAQCNLMLFANDFGAGSNPGSQEFKINIGGLEPLGGGVGSIFSSGNFFEGSTVAQPFFLGGNRSSQIGQFPNSNGIVIKPLKMVSKGDWGGHTGSMQTFPNIDFSDGTQMADAAYIRQSISNSIATPGTALDMYGAGHIVALVDPSAPSVVVNSGTGTSTTYKVTFRTFTGQTTNMSAGTTVSGGATPNNTITVNNVPKAAWFMDVIDATGAPKIIGTVNTTQFNGAQWSFTDNNATRNAYTPPTANNTASFTIDQNISGASGAFLVATTGDTTTRHLVGANSTPVANSCAGFSLLAGSSDTAGQLIYTSATTCSITFGHAYTNAPACTITPGSAASTTEVVATSAGFTATFGTAQTAFSWMCLGL